MEKKVTDNKEFAKKLMETIQDVFGENALITINIDTNGENISVNSEDKCIQKEKLKTPKELTLGEQYVLYLLDSEQFDLDNIDFENVVNTIVLNPLYDFMITKLSNDTKQNVLDFLSQLTESLMAVNFNKLRKL